MQKIFQSAMKQIAQSAIDLKNLKPHEGLSYSLQQQSKYRQFTLLVKTTCYLGVGITKVQSSNIEVVDQLFLFICEFVSIEF